VAGARSHIGEGSTSAKTTYVTYLNCRKKHKSRMAYVARLCDSHMTLCNKIKYNTIKQLEAVAVDSVYCLSQSETWRDKLAENQGC